MPLPHSGWVRYEPALQSLVDSMFFDADSPDSEFRAHTLCYRELIEAYLIEFDPVVDGCEPVFVELYAVAAMNGFVGYEVRQTASATANLLLTFSTGDEELARAVYEGEPSVASLVRYSPARTV